MAYLTREQALEAALLPCPFCGYDVTIASENNVRMFECAPGSSCRGSLLLMGFVAGDEETAIAQWNRRAALAMPPAQEAKTAFLLTEDGEFNGNAPEDDYVREAGTLVFDPGYLCVKSDGSGYFCVPDAEMVFEDDRSEGPDGPEGSVHWVARMNASEIVALRDFLNDAAPAQGVEFTRGWEAGWMASAEAAANEIDCGCSDGVCQHAHACPKSDVAAIRDLGMHPPAPAPWTPPEDKYVVWSHEHRAWWRSNSAGYTTALTRAGVYSRDDAISISHRARDRWEQDRIPNELPIRVSDLPEWAIRILAPEASHDR